MDLEVVVTSRAEKAGRDATLLAVLRAAARPLTALEVLAVVAPQDPKWNHELVRTDLFYLKRKGRVYHPAKGLWALADDDGGESAP